MAITTLAKNISNGNIKESLQETEFSVHEINTSRYQSCNQISISIHKYSLLSTGQVENQDTAETNLNANTEMDTNSNTETNSNSGPR